MLAAVVFALGAAALMAAASALQHQAATGASGYRTGIQLLVRLARSRRWMVGLVCSVVGLGLHGLALHSGPLALVQPLLVTSLVFALPLRAALDRATPAAAEVIAAVVVVIALAGFLIAANPTAGHPGAKGRDAAWVLGVGVALVAACSATATRTRSARVAGFCLGLATGILFGLVGGCLKAAVHELSRGGWALATGWPLWALIVSGVWAIVVNQRAYTRAPLRVSLPVLTVANPIVAVVFGAFVFSEKPGDTVVRVLAQLASLAVLAAAVTTLAAGSAASGSEGDAAR